MIQEFHISVTPLGNERYLVRTERVASGVPLAEEQVVWSVEEWLAQTRYLMNDPLLGLLHGTNRIGGFELPEGEMGEAASESVPPPITLVELGQQLYSALFQGRLRDSWMTAQGIAQHKGEILRLRLGLKGSRLLRLPWEVMYGSVDPAFDRSRYADGLSPAPRPIAAGTDVIFSRYQPGTNLMDAGSLAVAADQPLRILMAIATPSDQERLELMAEARQLQQELRGHSGESFVGKTPDIQLTVLEQPGRERLTQELEQGQYQVFHYAGHSNLGFAGGALYLVNQKTGLSETLSGDDLAGLLVNNNIRMAVFNSCRGAHTPTALSEVDSVERNLAEALVSRGIPAVLAMAERIPDDVALNLTRLFYRNLKQGYPIDRSLSRARQGLITSYSSHQLYWALPILYLHADFDGYLTGGDRSTDSTSDRLLIMPPTPQLPNQYPDATLPPRITPLSSTTSLESDDDLDMITRAVLDDDDLSDLGYEVMHYPSNGADVEPDDDYQQDVAVVAELIEQLSRQPGVEARNYPPAEVLAPTIDPVFAQELDTPLALDLPDIPLAPPYPADQADYSPTDPSLAKADWTTVNTSAQRHRIRRHYVLLPLVGVVGAMAITFVVMRIVPNLLSRPIPTLPTSPSVSPVSAPQESFNQDFFGRADSVTLTEVAINRFSHNDLNVGQKAVEALLDRGAIEEATAALDEVSPSDLDNPDISFLRGRLAWESLKRGNTDYGIEDVRRYWLNAVEGKPDVASYQMALGFAYYANGQSEEAIATFCQALGTVRSQTSGNTSASAEADCSVPTPPVTDDVSLNTLAGLALAYKQGSERETLEDDPEAAISQSLQFYQVVTQSDPVRFRPNALPQTSWLWTEPAVEEWRSLSTR